MLYQAAKARRNTERMLASAAAADPADPAKALRRAANKTAHGKSEGGHGGGKHGGGKHGDADVAAEAVQLMAGSGGTQSTATPSRHARSETLPRGNNSAF
jgi:hypothetical protein